mmetsp:Transcript_68151/g.197368  ORF Transcript_68151/g.197368 Transcript_68151/m.197368 type:complete len:295 (+) Transcript_68151:75-959(+)
MSSSRGCRSFLFRPAALLRTVWVVGAALRVGAVRRDVFDTDGRVQVPLGIGPSGTEGMWPWSGARRPAPPSSRAVPSEMAEAGSAIGGIGGVEVAPSESSDADALGATFGLAQLVFGTEAAPALIRRRTDCEAWSLDHTWWKDTAMILPYFYRMTQCGRIGNTATIVDCSTGLEAVLKFDQAPMELRSNRTLSVSVKFGDLPERLDLKRAEWRGSLTSVFGECKTASKVQMEIGRLHQGAQARARAEAARSDATRTPLYRRVSSDLPSIAELHGESDGEEDEEAEEDDEESHAG